VKRAEADYERMMAKLLPQAPGRRIHLKTADH